ncbi:mitogen-activated protein kinase kinase kinase 3-like [Styela clava]
MGNKASTTASPSKQEAAKKALATMCEAVADAVLVCAQLEDEWAEENNIKSAAREVLKICEKQVTGSATELIKAIRAKKMEQMMTKGQGQAEAFRRKLQADLLFLELLKVAIDQQSGEGSSRSGSQSGTTISHPWSRKDDLGKGAFGTVYAAVDKNGLKFAVKEVPKAGVQESCLRDEVKLLGKLSHKNVVKLYGCAGDKEKFYMYMELMQGSVKDKMEKSGKPIPQNFAKKYTKDLLQGLIYLHKSDVIHRDIKCANLLLDVNETVKLADMGISKIHDHATMIRSADDTAGTLPWMSPEVLSGQEGGKRSDVWSVGCTVFEMVKAAAPFQEELPPILFAIILPKMILGLGHRKLVSDQDDFGPALQSFLLKIFVKMNDRPFAEQIADHPWVR